MIGQAYIFLRLRRTMVLLSFVFVGPIGDGVCKKLWQSGQHCNGAQSEYIFHQITLAYKTQIIDFFSTCHGFWDKVHFVVAKRIYTYLRIVYFIFFLALETGDTTPGGSMILHFDFFYPAPPQGSTYIFGGTVLPFQSNWGSLKGQRTNCRGNRVPVA